MSCSAGASRCGLPFARTSSFARTSRQLQFLASSRRRTSYLTSAREGHNVPSTCTRPSVPIVYRPVQTSPARKEAVHTTSDFGRPTTNNDASATPLPAYQIPTSGILAILPKAWVPYAELIRLDKPIGTYYLFLPCLFSTLLAAPLTDPIASPTTVLGTAALFFSGALIMRGAGCTVNDLWDRDLDPQVARTRLRPIARGAVTVREAIPYLGAQLFAGLAILLQFPFECFWYATPSLIFVTIYPLAKRVTNYPQFVLGLTFSWGAVLGFPALGIDLLSNTPALLSAACLYSSCVAWTMVYDMIYAYQDIKDDTKAGIKSIALAQEANGKAFLSAVSGVQVALLAAAGLAIDASPIYFIGTCGGAALTLGYMIRKVNLKSVQDCWAWFKKGAWFTGGAIAFGLTAEYMAHYLGLVEIKKTNDEQVEI